MVKLILEIVTVHGLAQAVTFPAHALEYHSAGVYCHRAAHPTAPSAPTASLPSPRAPLRADGRSAIWAASFYPGHYRSPQRS